MKKCVCSKTSPWFKKSPLTCKSPHSTAAGRAGAAAARAARGARTQAQAAQRTRSRGCAAGCGSFLRAATSRADSRTIP